MTIPQICLLIIIIVIISAIAGYSIAMRIFQGKVEDLETELMIKKLIIEKQNKGNKKC